MPKYDWGDRKGKVHTRRKRSAAQLGKAKRRKAQGRADARLNRDPLYDPSSTLSGANLSRAADALVGLEFNPQRKALQQEATQAQRQGGAVQSRASDYFLQLAQGERGNVERSQALGGMLQQRLGDIGKTSQTAIDTSQARTEDLLRADEGTRGAGLQGDQGRLMEELAAARARSTASTQTAQQDAAAQTQGYTQLADLSRQAREVRGGEVVGQVANATSARLADVATRRAALESQVGPARTEKLLGLRQSGFENAATAAGLGLDQAKLQAQIQQTRSDASLARAKLRSTNRQNRARNRLTQQQINATLRGQTISAYTQRRGQNISSQDRALDRATRLKIAATRRAGGKLESADAQKLKTSVSNALADITSGQPLTITDNGKTKTYTNPAKYLRDAGASGIVIRAAMERKTGGLNYDTARELRQLGVRVPRNWVRGRPRRNPAKDRPGPQGH
jgi:hypothetical protein